NRGRAWGLPAVFLFVDDGLMPNCRRTLFFAAAVSDQIDAIRQLITARLRARKVSCEQIATLLHRHDESLGNLATAHMPYQRIEGALPFRLRHARGYSLVGNDASVVLCKRDEDQDARAVLLVRDAAGNELLHRDPVRDRAPRRAWNQRNTNPRQAERCA